MPTLLLPSTTYVRSYSFVFESAGDLVDFYSGVDATFFFCVYFIGEPEINRRNGSSCYRDRGGQIYVAACFRIAVRGWLDILTVERNFIY